MIDQESLRSWAEGLERERFYRLAMQLRDPDNGVILLRFGLWGKRRHTLAEIGHMLGVTRGRVWQIEKRALRKMRFVSRQTLN